MSIIINWDDAKNIPNLAVIRIGNDAGAISYERSLQKNEKINVISLSFDDWISNDVVKSYVRKFDDDKDIHGILLLRPVPEHINLAEIAKQITPKKDVDGLRSFIDGRIEIFTPCTAEAAMTCVHEVFLDGQHAVVIGRSNTVGRPLASLLLSKNATVTVCHSKTSDELLQQICRKANYLFCAAGQAKMIKAKHVKKSMVIVDIGLSMHEGKLVGDVDYEDIERKIGKVTIHNDIGKRTNDILLQHLYKAMKL